jgi:hypothetical protein
VREQVERLAAAQHDDVTGARTDGPAGCPAPQLAGQHRVQRQPPVVAEAQPVRPVQPRGGEHRAAGLCAGEQVLQHVHRRQRRRSRNTGASEHVQDARPAVNWSA